MEEIASHINRQFNRELAGFMRLMLFLVVWVLLLMGVGTAVRAVRTGRILPLPLPLVLPLALFGICGLLCAAFIVLDRKRLHEADVAIDTIETGCERELKDLVRTPELLAMALQRRHLRRGLLSDYLAYVGARLPAEMKGESFIERWRDQDVLREVAEASRDCEKHAPLPGAPWLIFILILGLSQGVATSAEEKYTLNFWGRAGVQFALMLLLSMSYVGYINSRRKPGTDRFRRIVDELTNDQLKDLLHDPQLSSAVKWEINLREKRSL